MRDAFSSVHAGGVRRTQVGHPIAGKGTIAQLDLSITAVRDGGYEADEVNLDIVPSTGFAGSNLLWQLTTRVLISISPPEQGWDPFKDTYSNIGEVGAWTARVAQLDGLVDSNTLAESVPGTVSHYSHRKHLAGSTIAGTAVRALCGAFFVPTQDHESLPTCPICQDRFADLPR